MFVELVINIRLSKDLQLQMFLVQGQSDVWLQRVIGLWQVLAPYENSSTEMLLNQEHIHSL